LTPDFHWEDETAVISAGMARLRIQGIPNDPIRWAVFDGFCGIGTVPRRADDATPLGEQRLWTRLADLLDAAGRDPNQWESGSGRGRI
jgi:hypothetical protein